MNPRGQAKMRLKSMNWFVAIAAAAGLHGCDQANAANNSGQRADNVQYSNAKSGLTSTTVQGALDEIGTTAVAALNPSDANVGTPGSSTTTWNASDLRLDARNVQLVSTPGFTVTFVDTGDGQGTYEATPSNVLVEDLTTQFPTTGKYWIVGHQMMTVAVDQGGSTGAIGVGWSLNVGNAGTVLSLADGGIVVRLTRQP